MTAHRTEEPALTGTEQAGRAIEASEFRRLAGALEQQLRRVIVGQEEAVRGSIVCLIAGGNALLEGVPGLGKTTLARGLARAAGLSHTRIQFTPDLLPADITGTTVLLDNPGGGPRLEFEQGPVFAGVVLADEINRASPRTQSALLEAMQEQSVTISGVTHPLPDPFCVLATQNPVDLQGTYPLPEAQLDRFLLKLKLAYPTPGELTRILADDELSASVAQIERVADAETLISMRSLARTVPVASHLLSYITRLLLALQPDSPDALKLARQYLRLGPSPRGGQAISLAGRITALLAGRANLAFEDVRAVAAPALRHRLVLSFDAERHAITADQIIANALAEVPTEGR